LVPDNAMQLHNNAAQQSKSNQGGMVSIGEAARQLIEEQCSKNHTAFDSVENLCRQLLPASLMRHSSIAGITGGQLKIQADSPSYMYELQLCSSKLLDELRRQCPRVRLKEIKVILA
jgi:hypothetical protein